MENRPTDSSFQQIQHQLEQTDTTLVAVSKTKPNQAILELYEQGQRIFGENRVQEFVHKAETLPKDINWHFIGHLQSNKVKYLAPYIHQIHSIDSFKLLREINKQAAKHQRIINCFLQFKVAQEETKSGMTLDEGRELLQHPDLHTLKNVRINGVMGMGTFTDDEIVLRQEFEGLKTIFDQIKSSYFPDSPEFKEISMGMSGDYQLAIDCGSTMVRLGTILFGARNY